MQSSFEAIYSEGCWILYWQSLEHVPMSPVYTKLCISERQGMSPLLSILSTLYIFIFPRVLGRRVLEAL